MEGKNCVAIIIRMTFYKLYFITVTAIIEGDGFRIDELGPATSEPTGPFVQNRLALGSVDGDGAGKVAGADGQQSRAVAVDNVSIAELVGTVQTEDEPRPAVRVGALPRRLDGKIPHQFPAAGRSLSGQLAYAFFDTLSDVQV